MKWLLWGGEQKVCFGAIRREIRHRYESRGLKLAGPFSAENGLS